MALINFSPLTQKRWQYFRANRRGAWSLKIFLCLFLVTLFAEFICNDKPLLIRYEGRFYFPIFATYSEQDFKGDFET